MRLPILFAAFALATPCLAQTPPAPAKPPVLARAEACLRDNVADAVHVSTGAADAADFLIGYLCARPVSAAANYQRNTATVAAMKGMFSDNAGLQAMMAGDEKADADADAAETTADLPDMSKWFNGVSVDENTGEIVVSGEASNPMISAIRAQSGNLGQFFGDQRPSDLRELAGRLVLDARR